MTAASTLAGRLAERRAVLGATALATLVEFLPETPGVLLALSGLWLLLGATTALWYAVATRVVSTRDSAVLLAVGLSILGDIVVALVVNSALPLVGVTHPLTRTPLTVASALTILILAVVAAPAPGGAVGAAAWWRNLRTRPLPQGLGAVTALGVVTLTLSVAGPIRLNNQLGSQVSIAALISIAALLALLMGRRRRYAESVLGLGLFFAAAALLFLTSLRGWYITGHDIQREFEVFQLTANADRWNISAFRDPYNACLSINLLPTSLVRLTDIPGIYVFKVVLPLLFALAPVLVYRSVRNVAPRLVALLSAVLFMAFPTFFTDMMFLGRQEIAFVLLGCATLLLTDTGRPLKNRRIMFLALTTGIALAHYSTMYVLVAVLGAAFCTDLLWRLLSGLRRRTRPTAATRAFVTWWIVAATAAAVVVWVSPATHTTGQLRSTVVSSVKGLVGGGPRNWSTDVSYALFGEARVSQEQRLHDYRAETVHQTAPARAAGEYVPISVVNNYSVPAAEKHFLPLTPLGRTLHQHGVDVKTVDGFFHNSLARLLQLFLLLGVATTMWGKRKAFHPTRDQVTLTCGTIAVIGSLLVLPQLSVDYGILRGFQQGLFIFAPFVAAGMLWTCRWAGRRLSARLACALTILLFLCFTGVTSTLVGGNQPQLLLNNAGQYFDTYYSHPEERTAITWLKNRTPEEDAAANIQSEVQTDRYSFTNSQKLIHGRGANDIYPTLVRKQSYIFLGSTTVRKGEATIFYHGDLLTYRYPTGFLDTTKNKLYSSDGAEIYR